MPFLVLSVIPLGRELPDKLLPLVTWADRWAKALDSGK